MKALSVSLGMTNCRRQHTDIAVTMSLCARADSEKADSASSNGLCIVLYALHNYCNIVALFPKVY